MFLVDLYHTPRRKWLNLDDHAQTAWENIGKKKTCWYCGTSLKKTSVTVPFLPHLLEKVYHCLHA